MPDTIRDGTGEGTLAKVTHDSRLLVDSLTESITAERSRVGKLYGVGTGEITPTSSFSLGPVLWIQNDSNTEDLYFQRMVFGWNGGSTTWIKTCFAEIKYNTTVPTGDNTLITDEIENISLSGSTTATASGDTTVHKWDGTGTGMTGGTGGFAQNEYRLAQGDTEVEMDGEVILGPGDTMEITVTPEETGLFHAFVVYYFAPTGLGRSFLA